jgi:hypothetical protein
LTTGHALVDHGASLPAEALAKSQSSWSWEVMLVRHLLNIGPTDAFWRLHDVLQSSSRLPINVNTIFWFVLRSRYIKRAYSIHSNLVCTIIQRQLLDFSGDQDENNIQTSASVTRSSLGQRDCDVLHHLLQLLGEEDRMFRLPAWHRSRYRRGEYVTVGPSATKSVL